MHPDENITDLDGDEGINVIKNSLYRRKKYGIALRMKLLITEILEQDDIIFPKRLLSKIINRRKKELVKKKEIRNSKYDFSKNIIPSLKQVRKKLKNLYLP